MTFDCSVLWEALGAAGMLLDAEYQPATGSAAPLQVGFVQPDLDVVSGMVQSTEYKIEFQTSDMPTAKIGESILITNSAGVDVPYKMRANPEKRGDGYFSTVALTKI